MQVRRLGRAGPVSALALGGGGLGGVWGARPRAEAVATLHAAVEAGITLLDVAPLYGTAEEPRRAERVVGEAFGGRLPAGVRVVTKVVVEDGDEVEPTVRESLAASLRALRLERVDVLLHHCDLRPPRLAGALPSTLALERYREQLAPLLERLRQEGLIGAWGLTATGHPEAVAAALADDLRPAVLQTVTNVLESPGSLWNFAASERPDFAGTRRRAAAAGVGVMGIRAAQGGALTLAPEDSLPRPAERADHRGAAWFRALAAEWGIDPAELALRYALTLPDVDTVVIGVKDRVELESCLAAEAAGPLTAAEQAEIRRRRGAAAAARPQLPSVAGPSD